MEKLTKENLNQFKKDLDSFNMALVDSHHTIQSFYCAPIIKKKIDSINVI